jgi:hypothetical protein
MRHFGQKLFSEDLGPADLVRQAVRAETARFEENEDG